MAKRIAELTPEQGRRVCEEAGLDFESTAELPELTEVIGQDRAVEAIEFGMDITGRGFNIYVLGPAGTGKTTAIRWFVEERARSKPVPDDWCYVHNFDEPHAPRALRLPAGRGKEFRADMDSLVAEMRREIQQALEREEYEKARNAVVQEIQQRQGEEFSELEKQAQARGFTLQRGPAGVFVVPLHDGEPISPEKFASLPKEERERLQGKGQNLQEDLQKTVRTVRNVEREGKERLKELERSTVLFAVEHYIEALRDKYAPFEKVLAYLEAVKEDVVDNAPSFLGAQQEDDGGQQSLLAMVTAQQGGFALRYQVNLIVDNSETAGAPVVVEDNPAYQNVIGKVERQAQFGMLTTNFSMIKAGALHRANGGYLILEADHLLRNPFTYDALKHAIKNREVKITDLAEVLSVVSTAGLEPEPIPLDTKVIVIGSPMLYYLLFDLDEEFSELFKVKADFSVAFDRTSENERLYARFLASHCASEGWCRMHRSAIARIVEYGSELVGDQTKLSARFSHICDVGREANYWAHKAGDAVVSRHHVQKALDAKTRRSDRVEKLLQEMIERGDIFIDARGEVVGQVNGLSVLTLGDYSFGKPSRITARTYMGRGGVVNIEREVKMSGPIHDKGVLILAGYLNGKYGEHKPLSVSASIGFEQLYEGVEGDSASSAELYALLSSLAGLPIRQDLAVTGSVNQRGEVQPIGGATQKIEGFFEVCKAKGLTGSQGVLIPSTNVKNLMLRDEVVQAIREGQFHVYPVETIDQGIEILTGREAGEPLPDGTYPEGTVNRTVDDRLNELAERWKDFAAAEHPKDKGHPDGS